MKTRQTRPPVKLFIVSAVDTVPSSSFNHPSHLSITEIVPPPRKKRVTGNRSRSISKHTPPRRSRLEAAPLPAWNGSTETRPQNPARSGISNSAFSECDRKLSLCRTLPLALAPSFVFFQSVSNGFANNFRQLSRYFSALGGGSTVGNLTRTIWGLY